MVRSQSSLRLSQSIDIDRKEYLLVVQAEQLARKPVKNGTLRLLLLIRFVEEGCRESQYVEHHEAESYQGAEAAESCLEGVFALVVHPDWVPKYVLTNDVV